MLQLCSLICEKLNSINWLINKIHVMCILKRTQIPVSPITYEDLDLMLRHVGKRILRSLLFKMQCHPGYFHQKSFFLGNFLTFFKKDKCSSFMAPSEK